MGLILGQGTKIPHALWCGKKKHKKQKTKKTPEDNIGENLGFDNETLDTTPKAQSMKEKNDKLNLIKIKNFHSVKDTIKRMKRQATDWEKIIVRYISNNKHVSKIYNELLKNSTIRKQKSQFNSG